MRMLPLVFLAGCWGSSPTPVATQYNEATPPPIVSFDSPDADGRRFAVVRITSIFGECSNLGGEHYVLETDEPTPRMLHAGGHGIYAGLKVGTWFVAEVLVAPRTDEDHDQNPDSSRGGWCLSELPTDFDGMATRLVPARDRAEARALLGEVMRIGMAPPSVEMKVATSGVGAGRVREVTSDKIVLEPIEGVVPAWIAIGNEQVLPKADDIVVIAKRRYFIAESTAKARKWFDAIAKRGWPPAPIELDSGFATARWIGKGTVEAGTACGPMITIEEGGSPGFMLERMTMPAPANARVGDRVEVVAFARFEPDACGNTLRAVRVKRGNDRLLD